MTTVHYIEVFMLHAATPAEARRKRIEDKFARVRETMTPELIKQFIACASEREEGFTIQSIGSQVHRRAMMVTFRNTKPSHVCITADGRYGFCIDNQSYITTGQTSTLSFMSWLSDANTKAPQGEDYGQPTCEFRRTN